MDSESQITLLNGFCAAWLMGSLVRLLLSTNFLRKGVSSNDVALILLVALYGIPLAILAFYNGDIAYPAPLFSAASADTRVAGIQAFFLVATASLLMLSRRSVQTGEAAESSKVYSANVGRFLSLLGQGLLLGAILLAAFSPEPSTYLQYGFYSQAATRHLVSEEMSLWHTWVSTCTTLSVICAGSAHLLRPVRQADVGSTVGFVCNVALAAWLNGKRNSVAIAVFLWLLDLFSRNRTKAGARLLLSCLVIFCFGIYSMWYQSRRGLGDVNTVESYLINYGRDHGLRLAIYSELNDEPILEYRGQSFLFNLCIAVPRSYWPDKPWPYATYLTSKAFGNHQVCVYPWQFTTSWLGECIANLGLLGLLFGPLSLIGICNINDRVNRPFVRGLGYPVIGLLLAVHIPSFFPLFIFWIAAVGWCFFYRGSGAGARALCGPANLENESIRQAACSPVD